MSVVHAVFVWDLQDEVYIIMVLEGPARTCMMRLYNYGPGRTCKDLHDEVIYGPGRTCKDLHDDKGILDVMRRK